MAHEVHEPLLEVQDVVKVASLEWVAHSQAWAHSRRRMFVIVQMLPKDLVVVAVKSSG